MAPAALGARVSVEDVFPFEVLKLRHAKVNGPFTFHGLKSFEGNGFQHYLTIKGPEKDVERGGKDVQMF